jgi:hypothetical protein
MCLGSRAHHGAKRGKYLSRPFGIFLRVSDPRITQNLIAQFDGEFQRTHWNPRSANLCITHKLADGFLESQRDFVPKPRVARHELPWETKAKRYEPQRGSVRNNRSVDATPLGGWGTRHRVPRVGAARQPLALLRNPVGIHWSFDLELWVMHSHEPWGESREGCPLRGEPSSMISSRPISPPLAFHFLRTTGRGGGRIAAKGSEHRKDCPWKKRRWRQPRLRRSGKKGRFLV